MLYTIEIFIITVVLVYVLCRRGNDSQRSINHMEKLFPEYTFLNVTGGLYAYAKNVDPEFPIY